MFNLVPTKIKILVGFLIILIFITGTALFIVSITQEPIPKPTLAPSPQIPIPAEEPGYTGPEPGSVYQTSTPESERLARINLLNGLLLKKLPYSEKYFTLMYDYDQNSFIAIYVAGFEDQGKEDLSKYLKSNEIEKSDWLINFKTEVK